MGSQTCYAVRISVCTKLHQHLSLHLSHRTFCESARSMVTVWKFFRERRPHWSSYHDNIHGAESEVGHKRPCTGKHKTKLLSMKVPSHRKQFWCMMVIGCSCGRHRHPGTSGWVRPPLRATARAAASISSGRCTSWRFNLEHSLAMVARLPKCTTTPIMDGKTGLCEEQDPSSARGRQRVDDNRPNHSLHLGSQHLPDIHPSNVKPAGLMK